MKDQLQGCKKKIGYPKCFWSSKDFQDMKKSFGQYLKQFFQSKGISQEQRHAEKRLKRQWSTSGGKIGEYVDMSYSNQYVCFNMYF